MITCQAPGTGKMETGLKGMWLANTVFFGNKKYLGFLKLSLLLL
jgi:hypothetical protein